MVKFVDFGLFEMVKEIERMRDFGGIRGIDVVIDIYKVDVIVFLLVCFLEVFGFVGYLVVCVLLGFLFEGIEVERNIKVGFGGVSVWYIVSNFF